MIPGSPRKGTHSVGVARQYCGQVGKQENCRVAVSVSVGHRAEASLPVAYQSVSSGSVGRTTGAAQKGWRAERDSFPDQAGHRARTDSFAAERERCRAASVLADAAYGNDTSFRVGSYRTGSLLYAVGIQSSTTRLASGHGAAAAPSRKERNGPSATAAAEGSKSISRLPCERTCLVPERRRLAKR